MDADKVTCFYRYNRKTGKFDYNHYEDGWIDFPKKEVGFEPGEWYAKREFKVGASITTNGVFK